MVFIRRIINFFLAYIVGLSFINGFLPPWDYIDYYTVQLPKGYGTVKLPKSWELKEENGLILFVDKESDEIIAEEFRCGKKGYHERVLTNEKYKNYTEVEFVDSFVDSRGGYTQIINYNTGESGEIVKSIVFYFSDKLSSPLEMISFKEIPEKTVKLITKSYGYPEDYRDFYRCEIPKEGWGSVMIPTHWEAKVVDGWVCFVDKETEELIVEEYSYQIENDIVDGAEKERNGKYLHTIYNEKYNGYYCEEQNFSKIKRKAYLGWDSLLHGASDVNFLRFLSKDNLILDLFIEHDDVLNNVMELVLKSYKV